MTRFFTGITPLILDWRTDTKVRSIMISIKIPANNKIIAGCKSNNEITLLLYTYLV